MSPSLSLKDENANLLRCVVSFLCPLPKSSKAPKNQLKEPKSSKAPSSKAPKSSKAPGTKSPKATKAPGEYSTKSPKSPKQTKGPKSAPTPAP